MKRITETSLRATIASLFWLSAAVAALGADKAAGTTIEDVRAQLPEILVSFNGGQISRDEVWPRIQGRLAKRLAAGHTVSPGMLRFMVGRLIPVLCDTRILLPKARAAGFEPDLKRAEAHLADMEATRGTKAVEAMLAYEGLGRDAFAEQLAERNAIKDWVTRDFVGKQTVSEEEVRRFYQEHPQEVAGRDLAQFQRIFAKSAAPDADTSARERIEGVRQAVAAGVSFAQAAKRAEMETSPPRTVTRGRGEDPLEKELFALKAGEISKVIEVTDGFAIFHCLERRSPQMPKIEDVRDWLEQRVREEKGGDAFDTYMKTVYKDANIQFLYKKPLHTVVNGEKGAEARN